MHGALYANKSEPSQQRFKRERWFQMPNPTPSASRPGAAPPQFPPLELETRPRVSTEAAAHYLNRRPQTLRIWASSGHSPLRPTRIHGRLAWPVADIRKLLEVSA